MKRNYTLILLIILFMSFVIVTPHTNGFAQGIQVNTTTTWQVKAAPSVGFDMHWADGGGWIADNNSLMMFSVSNVGEDIEGSLTLGNLTVAANDTEIAKDLTLGVWGATEWLPGLFVEVGQSNFDDLNETAYAAAERVQYNYLNGTMTSRYDNITIDSTSFECLIFDYEQDPTGFSEPQVTHLAYSLETGVLVEASTSYSFETPYLLELELDLTVRVDPLFITIGIAISIIVIIAVVIVTRRR